jgi:predicted aspartyl protease
MIRGTETFSVDIEIARIGADPKLRRVRNVMVGTGAAMTWMAASTLRSIGIRPWKKDQPFVMANGQRITRQVGHGIIGCGEFKTVDEIVFAEDGDLQLLGACTFEGFNAVVDARRKRLVAAGPVPAALLH